VCVCTYAGVKKETTKGKIREQNVVMLGVETKDGTSATS